MQEYPYSSAQILSDAVFLNYGGESGTSTAGQRNAAYFIAEHQMTSHIGTLLIPTNVTGTFSAAYRPVITDYGHVNYVTSILVNTIQPCNCSLVANNGCVLIRNDSFGYLDVNYILSNCGCNSSNYPYNISLAYNAGYPTGTSMQPDMLLGLTIAAQINLNEMDNHTLHNEGAYDIGVQRFNSLGYSEERVKLGHNAFGSSAAAQKIANLVKGYVRRPALRFH